VRAFVATLLATGVALVLAQPAGAASLQAGVGRSDITPPTGFPTMGYVRDDAIARGQHTRLYALSAGLASDRFGNRNAKPISLGTK
jgi:hypothetical protein